MLLPITEAPILRPDKDGILIPHHWEQGIKNWEAQPTAWRQKYVEEYLEKVAAALQPKPTKEHKPGATRFTTDYAIEWGRKKGWKLVERESYDYRLERHHDCVLGMDAIFEDRQTLQLIGVQGAGRSERKAHLQRFEERGGVAKANARNMAIFYVEFERGNKTPVFLEKWA